MEREGILMMIETHAHIYSDDYTDDRHEMLERGWKTGIEQIWMPNCDSRTIAGMMELAEKYPGKCLPMIGLHPTYVKDDFEDELAIMEEWLAKYPFIAVGEIGMDLFWDVTFREQQEKAFLHQCKLARQHNLWIDIHSRNAFSETVRLIEEFADPHLTGIFHCFTGTLEEAEKAIELGFKLGIGGVATFKNGGLDKVIPFIGLENMVLETDSPYLAPVPFRGKRNEVSYIDLVAQRIADLKQITKSEVISATTETAQKLLHINVP
jgi:TatD DNase family protein